MFSSSEESKDSDQNSTVAMSMSVSDDARDIIKSTQVGDFDWVYRRIVIERKYELANSVDESGCSVLHWAAINNRLKIATLLINHRANVNLAAGNLNEIPLQWAVRNDKSNLVTHLLVSSGSNLNHKNIYGHTSLHIAARSGNIHNAFILLSNGADVDSVDVSGSTPLYCLIKDKNTIISIELHRQVFRLLINFGANVLHMDNEGNTAMHIMANEIDFDPYIALIVLDTCGYSQDLVFSNALEALNTRGEKPTDVANKNRNLNMIAFFFEAFCYRSYTKMIPVFISAFIVFICFFVPYYLNAMFSSIILIPTIYMLSKLLQDQIVKDKSRVHMGWALGIIVSELWGHFTFVAHLLSWKWSAIVIVLSLAICYTMYKAHTTPPAHLLPTVNKADLYNKIVRSGFKDGLTENDEELSVNVGESSFVSSVDGLDRLLNDRASFRPLGNEFESNLNDTNKDTFSLDMSNFDNDEKPSRSKLCTACLCDKSLASTHCFRCDMCVVDLDHHCDFVSNCVGQGNRRVFVWFTLFASSGTMLVYLLAAYTHSHILGFTMFDSRASVVHQILKYTSFLVSLWIGSIAVGQFFVVASETTTFEVLRKRNDGACSCDKRSFVNLWSFFMNGKYKVTSQSKRREGNIHSCNDEKCKHSQAVNHKKPSVVHESANNFSSSSGIWSSWAKYIFGKSKTEESKQKLLRNVDVDNSSLNGENPTMARRHVIGSTKFYDVTVDVGKSSDDKL